MNLAGSESTPHSIRIADEIIKRRTFCIISHPDAGKTTITEKILLFGGAIQMAGTVKSRKSKKFAQSDWMEIEKQRGISVTSSVIKFFYANCEINLLDTPGHQDFLEDTYRAITAVDSALMIIDGAKGVEEQTIKLWDICRIQKIPVAAFINKLDREVRSPLDLMADIENVLDMECVPITWPISQGKDFKGVYDREILKVRLFKSAGEKRHDSFELLGLDDKRLPNLIGALNYKTLIEDLDLLNMAGNTFDLKKYLTAQQIPVFFGSAVNNFGIQELLNKYLQISPPPKLRMTDSREVSPLEDSFSGFVFKIQANMDKNHRDRIAFIRVCSGYFQKGMKIYHIRLKRYIKVANPIIFKAQTRTAVDSAFAGDIFGIVDTNNFQVGDSLSVGEEIKFIGLPNFAPEYFLRVKLNNPLKSKPLDKGLKHLTEEGSVQLFYPKALSGYIVGVVGRLQLEVMQFRLLHEYGADCEFVSLPYKLARWYKTPNLELKAQFEENHSNQVYLDRFGKHVFLAESVWAIDYVKEKYPKIDFFNNSDDV